MRTGLYENSIQFRYFDEDLLDTLIELEPDIGFVCGACNRRNCFEVQKWPDGVEREGLKCTWLMVVDGKHWRPVCDECLASFGTPPSTAAKLFGL
jgi:hypothetical protein